MPKKKILIVDDQILIAESTAHKLSLYGYDVLIENNGKKVLATFQDFNPDLVLLDINLGNAISGTDIAEEILDIKKIPIVFFTSYTDKEVIEKVRKITRYGFVLKDSGDFVLESSIHMAFELFEADRKSLLSIQRLQELLNISHDFICFKDGEGKWLEANLAALQLFNIQNVDYKGKKNSELAKHSPYFAETLLSSEASDELAWNSIIPYRNDEKIPQIGGGYRLIDWIKVPSFNDDNTRKGLIVIGKDVTKKRKEEISISKVDDRFQLQQSVLNKLSQKESFVSQDFNSRKHEIIRSAAEALPVDRIGIWYLNDKEKMCDCDLIYEKDTNTFSNGLKLKYDNFGLPLDKINHFKSVAIDDVIKSNPNITPFFSYIKANGIISALDASIKIDGKSIGLVSFESTKELHHWEKDEIAFAQQIADQISILLILSQKEEYEKSLYENSISPMLIIEGSTFSDCNEAAVRILKAQSKKQILGKKPWELSPELQSDGVNSMTKAIDFINKTDAVGSHSFEWAHVNFNNEAFHVVVTLTKIKFKRKDIYFVVWHEITERKLAEEKVQKLLEEKEILLKEVHHRIKNNMLTISSLLYLQADLVKSTPAYQTLKESINRVNSMMLIYNRLYQSNDFRQIDLRNYLIDLLRTILSSYNVDASKVNLTYNIDNLIIDAKTALPIGIIINELFSNVFKYAFPHSTENKKNELQLKVEKTDGAIEILVRDNGVGLPPDIDPSNPKSFGLKLVSLFVQQLRGKIDVKSNNGSEFKISFNI